MKSSNWRERAASIIPLGSSTNSKVPRYTPEEPEVVTKGKGCRIWDDRNREFIDFRNALGAVSLGYCDSDVDAAILTRLSEGISFGHPNPLEVETAELFCSLVPGAEAARFLKTGGEALAALIRIARAYTGREEIIQIGYNGWLNSLGKGAQILPNTSSDQPVGVPESLSQLHHPVSWNDRQRIGELFRERAGRIALVLVAADYPGLEDAHDFYPYLRRLTSEHGALLGYDEMVTGFRVSLGGMAEYTGIEADLYVHGKGLANGMPLSVYSGKRDILSVLDRGEVVVTSTLAGETLSMAAAQAAMRKIRDTNVPAHMKHLGTLLQEGMNRLFHKSGIPIRLIGHPTCPQFVEPTADEGQLLSRFFRIAFAHGLSFYRVVYVNAAHTEEDISETLERLKSVCKELQRESTPTKESGLR